MTHSRSNISERFTLYRIAKHFLKSYSQTFPEIMFTCTCIFPTQKYRGFRPGLFPYVQTRPFHVRYVVNNDFTTQRCWCNGERVHWFYLPTMYVMCTSYIQVYFLTVRKDFHRNAQNSMCMQYFSADEKACNNHPVLFSFAHVNFFFSWVWGLEQWAITPPPIHNNWHHVQSRVHQVHI